jgi:hypothetical protein
MHAPAYAVLHKGNIVSMMQGVASALLHKRMLDMLCILQQQYQLKIAYKSMLRLVFVTQYALEIQSGTLG